MHDALGADSVGTTGLGVALLDCVGATERYYANSVRAAKTLTDWVWQVLLQMRSWLPERRVAVVALAVLRLFIWWRACNV